MGKPAARRGRKAIGTPRVSQLQNTSGNAGVFPFVFGLAGKERVHHEKLAQHVSRYWREGRFLTGGDRVWKAFLLYVFQPAEAGKYHRRKENEQTFCIRDVDAGYAIYVNAKCISG